MLLTCQACPIDKQLDPCSRPAAPPPAPSCPSSACGGGAGRTRDSLAPSAFPAPSAPPGPSFQLPQPSPTHPSPLPLSCACTGASHCGSVTHCAPVGPIPPLLGTYNPTYNPTNLGPALDSESLPCPAHNLDLSSTSTPRGASSLLHNTTVACPSCRDGFREQMDSGLKRKDTTKGPPLRILSLGKHHRSQTAHPLLKRGILYLGFFSSPAQLHPHTSPASSARDARANDSTQRWRRCPRVQHVHHHTGDHAPNICRNRGARAKTS